MTYASASDVAAYCSGLTEAGQFTETTHPSRDEVSSFLNRADSVIDAALNGAGYSTPIDSAATVYNAVVDLAAIFAASRAHLTVRATRLGGDEPGKAEALMDWFDRELERLLKGDLSRAGAGRSSGGSLYCGGISISDKASVEGDSDRVAPRFQRDQFSHPESRRPYVSGARESD